MTGKTHFLFGLGLGLYLASHSQNGSEALFMIAASSLGSLLPDLDAPRSIITNLFPPLRLLFFWTTHRGILHTGLIVALLLLVAYLLHSVIALALALGYASHLLLDSLTHGGIPLFFPLWRGNVHLLPQPVAITTGGLSESLFVLMSLIAVFYVLYPSIVPYLAMFGGFLR